MPFLRAAKDNSVLVLRVRWDDFSEAFPAFLTLVATPLTFSIATGLSLGLLSFTFVKLGTGRRREISPLIWVLSVLFLLRYAFLGAEIGSNPPSLKSSNCHSAGNVTPVSRSPTIGRFFPFSFSLTIATQ